MTGLIVHNSVKTNKTFSLLPLLLQRTPRRHTDGYLNMESLVLSRTGSSQPEKTKNSIPLYFVYFSVTLFQSFSLCAVSSSCCGDKTNGAPRSPKQNR